MAEDRKMDRWTDDGQTEKQEGWTDNAKPISLWFRPGIKNSGFIKADPEVCGAYRITIRSYLILWYKIFGTRIFGMI